MHSGKLVFAKFMEHLPLHTFRLGVRRYPAKYPTKTFSHLDQFLIMAFAQLTYRESLRDIETCLRAHQTKLYHLGIRSHVAKSTLADANEQRDWRIYADFAMSLIQTARKLYENDCFAVELDQTAYAHQGVLRHYQERSEDANLDRDHGLRLGRYREKTTQARCFALYNSTNLEPHAFRENTVRSTA